METIAPRGKRISEKIVMQAIFCLSLVPALLGWFSIDPVIHFFSGLGLLMGDVIGIVLIIALESLLWLAQYDTTPVHVSIVVLLFVFGMNYFRVLVVGVFWSISEMNLAFLGSGLLPGFWVSVGGISLDILLYVMWLIYKRQAQEHITKASTIGSDSICGPFFANTGSN
ncbi:MAG: hypothetical protein LBK75_00845 [Oscillospiraceae bacterium]|jgi:hypothetical protein|nr:hypothetical protein [Oscillospiraceae bacterium]